MGRDTKFSEELALHICEDLAAGKSLRQICEPEGMPSESAVRLWVLEDRGGFSAQYARAREAQADTFADEIVEIADVAKDANLARVKIDARKWAASKLKPKTYGDRLDLNHSGSIQQLTDEQIESRLTQLLGKAGTGELIGGDGAA